MADDDLLPFSRPDELARRWRVHEQTVTAMLRSGRLRGFKLQKLWLVPRENIERFERGEEPPGEHIVANKIERLLKQEVGRRIAASATEPETAPTPRTPGGRRPRGESAAI
jgi:excisionase family DNA binding protein